MTGASSRPSKAVQDVACRIHILLDTVNSRDLGPQTEQSFARLLQKGKYGWQAEVVLREVVGAMASNLTVHAAQVGQRLCARIATKTINHLLPAQIASLLPWVANQIMIASSGPAIQGGQTLELEELVQAITARTLEHAHLAQSGQSPSKLSSGWLSASLIKPMTDAISRDPDKQQTRVSCRLLHAVLAACLEWATLPSVVAACMSSLKLLIKRILSGGSMGDVPEAYAPLSQCICIIGSKLPAEIVSRAAQACLMGMGSKEHWSMRQQATEALACLAAVIQVHRQVGNGSWRLETSAGIGALMRLKGQLTCALQDARYDRIAHVRHAACRALKELAAIPDASSATSTPVSQKGLPSKRLPVSPCAPPHTPARIAAHRPRSRPWSKSTPPRPASTRSRKPKDVQACFKRPKLGPKSLDFGVQGQEDFSRRVSAEAAQHAPVPQTTEPRLLASGLLRTDPDLSEAGGVPQTYPVIPSGPAISLPATPEELVSPAALPQMAKEVPGEDAGQQDEVPHLLKGGHSGLEFTIQPDPAQLRLTLQLPSGHNGRKVRRGVHAWMDGSTKPVGVGIELKDSSNAPRDHDQDGSTVTRTWRLIDGILQHDEAPATASAARSGIEHVKHSHGLPEHDIHSSGQAAADPSASAPAAEGHAAVSARGSSQHQHPSKNDGRTAGSPTPDGGSQSHRESLQAGKIHEGTSMAHGTASVSLTKPSLAAWSFPELSKAESSQPSCSPSDLPLNGFSDIDEGHKDKKSPATFPLPTNDDDVAQDIRPSTHQSPAGSEISLPHHSQSRIGSASATGDSQEGSLSRHSSSIQQSRTSPHPAWISGSPIHAWVQSGHLQIPPGSASHQRPSKASPLRSHIVAATGHPHPQLPIPVSSNSRNHLQCGPASGPNPHEQSHLTGSSRDLQLLQHASGSQIALKTPADDEHQCSGQEPNEGSPVAATSGTIDRASLDNSSSETQPLQIDSGSHMPAQPSAHAGHEQSSQQPNEGPFLEEACRGMDAASHSSSHTEPQPLQHASSSHIPAQPLADAEHGHSSQELNDGSALAAACRAIDRLCAPLPSSDSYELSDAQTEVARTAMDASASLLWLAAGQPLEQLLTSLRATEPRQRHSALQTPAATSTGCSQAHGRALSAAHRSAQSSLQSPEVLSQTPWRSFPGFSSVVSNTALQAGTSSPSLVSVGLLAPVEHATATAASSTLLSRFNSQGPTRTASPTASRMPSRAASPCSSAGSAQHQQARSSTLQTTSAAVADTFVKAALEIGSPAAAYADEQKTQASRRSEASHQSVADGQATMQQEMLKRPSPTAASTSWGKRADNTRSSSARPSWKNLIPTDGSHLQMDPCADYDEQIADAAELAELEQLLQESLADDKAYAAAAVTRAISGSSTRPEALSLAADAALTSRHLPAMPASCHELDGDMRSRHDTMMSASTSNDQPAMPQSCGESDASLHSSCSASANRQHANGGTQGNKQASESSSRRLHSSTNVGATTETRLMSQGGLALQARSSPSPPRDGCLPGSDPPAWLEQHAAAPQRILHDGNPDQLPGQPSEQGHGDKPCTEMGGAGSFTGDCSISEGMKSDAIARTPRSDRTSVDHGADMAPSRHPSQDGGGIRSSAGQPDPATDPAVLTGPDAGTDENHKAGCAREYRSLTQASASPCDERDSSLAGQTAAPDERHAVSMTRSTAWDEPSAESAEFASPGSWDQAAASDNVDGAVADEHRSPPEPSASFFVPWDLSLSVHAPALGGCSNAALVSRLKATDEPPATPSAHEFSASSKLSAAPDVHGDAACSHSAESCNATWAAPAINGALTGDQFAAQAAEADTHSQSEVELPNGPHSDSPPSPTAASDEEDIWSKASEAAKAGFSPKSEVGLPPEAGSPAGFVDEENCSVLGLQGGWGDSAAVSEAGVISYLRSSLEFPDATITAVSVSPAASPRVQTDQPQDPSASPMLATGLTSGQALQEAAGDVASSAGARSIGHDCQLGPSPESLMTPCSDLLGQAALCVDHGAQDSSGAAPDDGRSANHSSGAVSAQSQPQIHMAASHLLAPEPQGSKPISATAKISAPLHRGISAFGFLEAEQAAAAEPDGLRAGGRQPEARPQQHLVARGGNGCNDAAAHERAAEQATTGLQSDVQCVLAGSLLQTVPGRPNRTNSGIIRPEADAAPRTQAITLAAAAGRVGVPRHTLQRPRGWDGGEAADGRIAAPSNDWLAKFGPASDAKLPFVAVSCNPLYVPTAAASRSPPHSPQHFSPLSSLAVLAVTRQAEQSSSLHADSRLAGSLMTGPDQTPRCDLQPRRLFSSAARHRPWQQKPSENQQSKPKANAGQLGAVISAPHKTGSTQLRPDSSEVPFFSGHPRHPHGPQGHAAAAVRHHMGSTRRWQSSASSKIESLRLAQMPTVSGTDRACPETMSHRESSVALHGHGTTAGDIAVLSARMRALMPKASSLANPMDLSHACGSQRWSMPSEPAELALPSPGENPGSFEPWSKSLQAVAAAGRSSSPEGRLKAAMQRLARIHARQAQELSLSQTPGERKHQMQSSFKHNLQLMNDMLQNHHIFR
ncbi:hypothetical protein WJX74_007540 [Apatococcus lobatus]|uniref:TOG domain-containing protein n=1 Tax=Apatococcus lobatus TaxID=904363 RepID=A0AAW1SBW0_9CHLO